MKTFVAAALGALALFAGSAFAATTDPAPDAPPAACDDNFVDTHWHAAVDAYRGEHLDVAATETDAIIAACGDDPRAGMPHIMRAELALRSGDAQRAADLIPDPPPTFYAAWMAMEAHDELGHADRVSSIATVLERMSGEALTRAGMTQVESFDAGGYHVTSYQGRLEQGPFIRFFYFLMQPVAGGMPVSIAISRDNIALEGSDRTYFVDFYQCSGHYTMSQFESAETVPYARARQAVDTFLAHPDSGNAVSATVPHDGLCAFPQYITPGLDN